MAPEPTPLDWLNGLRRMTVPEYLAFVKTLPAPRTEDLVKGRLGPGRAEQTFLEPFVNKAWTVINERPKSLIVDIVNAHVSLDYNNEIIVGAPEDIPAGIVRLHDVLRNPRTMPYSFRAMC